MQEGGTKQNNVGPINKYRRLSGLDKASGDKQSTVTKCNKSSEKI